MLILIVLLVTWATLTQTEPGTHVGPLHLYETFAQVQQTLGAAPVTKSDCDSTLISGCSPTMTYTDGANTLIISAQILSPYPNKVSSESQHVKDIELVRGTSKGATMFSRPGVHPLDSWTWESFGVFALPPKTIAGWKRSMSGDYVFYNKDVCGFSVSEQYPPGQIQFEVQRHTSAHGQWEFSLGYIDFVEGC